MPHLQVKSNFLPSIYNIVDGDSGHENRVKNAAALLAKRMRED